MRCVVDWVRRKRIFAGVRGTGLYSLEQDKLYRDIQEHLQNYRPVCLGTYDYPGAPEPGRRGGGGEHMSKGLAGPHAYAVLDCMQVGDVKYVRVHNPWGHTGRGYNFAPEFMRQQPSALTPCRDGSGAMTIPASPISGRSSTPSRRERARSGWSCPTSPSASRPSTPACRRPR